MRILIIYSAIFCCFYSCKKDEYETNYSGIDKVYFNESIGSYSVFEVYEVVYDDFQNSIDTFRYQIKELNESSFKDNLGRNATRIERYKRASDTSVWKYVNTWYSVLNVHMAERIEENKRYVKLSFPVSIDAVWNSNAFNMENVNNVYYGLMHQSFKLGTTNYDSVVSVENISINNIFRERSFKEVYAKYIGLIYKNYVYIDKAGISQKGIRSRYQLIKHVP